VEKMLVFPKASYLLYTAPHPLTPSRAAESGGGGVGTLKRRKAKAKRNKQKKRILFPLYFPPTLSMQRKFEGSVH
jgi:hypothetical protein